MDGTLIRITRITTFIVLILSVVACARGVDDRLIGTWQSDAEATLADMHKHPEVTEKSRKLFENDFFGHLIVTYTATDYLTDFKNIHTKTTYKVLDSTPGYVDTEHYEELYGKDVKERVYIDGPMIYVITSKYEFREYFKRIK